MNFLYKTMIVGIVFLLSNSTYAQIIQYSDDGTQSCIDCEAKNSNTERSCLCLGPFHLGIFNYQIPNDDGAERWLQGQELLLAGAITGVNYFDIYNQTSELPDGYNFEQIQKNYFKNVETNALAREYHPKVDDYFAQIKNYDKVALRTSTLNHQILDIRKREGTASPKYGDLKYKGQYLKEMSDGLVNAQLNEQLTIRNNQRAAFLRYDESRSRLESLVTGGWASDYLADLYIRHYKDLYYEDAIRFMTRYMAAINSNNASLVSAPFGNPHNIFTLADSDYTSRIAAVADLGPTMENWKPREFTERPDDQALYNLALKNLGSRIENFIRSTSNFSVKDVLELNEYTEGALNRYKDTFINYLNNDQSFDGDFEGSILSGAGTASDLPTDLGTELAYRFSFNETGVANGIRAYSNVLYTLFRLDENHKELEGAYLRAAFEADNQIDVGFLTDEQLATLFSFSTVYPWEGTYYNNFFIEYNIEIADILEHHNISLQNLIQNTPLFSMFGSISDAYLANKIDYTTLSNILNYLENEDLDTQTIQFIQNGINVLSNIPNANPFLGADCRSFEYAKPPGALQRGCAVKNLDNRFFTVGIRPNGSPYSGDIFIPFDIMYFTAPNSMTNGQAANATAIAVTNAIKAADLEFFENPDISAAQLNNFFLRILRIQMQAIGGSVSLTQEPFPIPNPAPYMTSVLGISNPFDCD